MAVAWPFGAFQALVLKTGVLFVPVLAFYSFLVDEKRFLADVEAGTVTVAVFAAELVQALIQWLV